MARFFVDPSAISGDRARLTGADAHHALRVLRLGIGDAITLLDGTGKVYQAQIAEASPGEVVARVVATGDAPEPPVAITLYQAMPKGDKLELILQKATELGAARIVAVPAARSVALLKGDKLDSKLARWQKIVHEAAEQSERGRVPEVAALPGLRQIRLPEGSLALVLSERERGLTLPRALPQAPPGAIALFVGPEGGWAPEELDWLGSLGALEVSLGPRILRTETAGLAALAIAMGTYEL